MIRSYKNIGLKPFNTFRLDSDCENLVEFDTPEDAPGAVALALSLAGVHQTAVVGGGSNIVFGDVYKGCLIRPAIMGWEATPLGNGRMEIMVGAGVTLDSLIEQLCNAGFWGLENLSGIPGSVGGAAVQNAGAYGVEIGELVRSLLVWDCNEHKYVTFLRSELGYGYRDSIFKKPENAKRYIVLRVHLLVSNGYNPKLTYGPLVGLAEVDDLTATEVRRIILGIRDSKLPNVEEIGSAGSYFKNPVLNYAEWHVLLDKLSSKGFSTEGIPHYEVEGGLIKIPAAWLIEQCGWKGKIIGNVGVWHKQPLILINATGKATPKEILDLEKAIIADVKSRFEIELSPEVVHL